MILGIEGTTILELFRIEITKVIVVCSFMQNVIHVMSKRLVFPLVMNMYAIFHTFSIIEVEFLVLKLGNYCKIIPFLVIYQVNFQSVFIF